MSNNKYYLLSNLYVLDIVSRHFVWVFLRRFLLCVGYSQLICVHPSSLCPKGGGG